MTHTQTRRTLPHVPRVRRKAKPPAPPPEEPSNAVTPSAELELLAEAIEERRALAASDLTEFFEAVMLHETTKEPLVAAPHQRVTFRFIEDFPHCVVRQPVGTAKTYAAATLALWLLGRDPTARGVLLSKAQGQAAKVLRMVSDYMTDPKLSLRLRSVFRYLRRTERTSELWNQNAITIHRPPGIRDASLSAVGLDGQVQGSRFSFGIGDDVLDSDNTLTVQAREQVAMKFDARFLSRLDPQGTRMVVSNTPWNLEDLTFQLEHAGWPTIAMDVLGNVWFSNVERKWIESTGFLRPSNVRQDFWRLVQHDPDFDEATPLWPERYSVEDIEHLRRTRLPHEFARLYLCQPFNEEASRCHREWVETCKRRGRGLTLVEHYTGGHRTYTGVDVAIGQTRSHDESCVFTIEIDDEGSRRILSIESGRFTGEHLSEIVIRHFDAYGSVIGVESNAAQDFLRQWVLSKRPDVKIHPHTTTKARKLDLDFGVESVFTELKQGAWIIPSDNGGRCHPEVQKFIDECVYYQPPPAHTGDRLMAAWIARERSRRGKGVHDPKPRAGLKLQMRNTGGF